MKKLLFLLLTAGLFASCSSAFDKKYTKDGFEDDVTALKEEDSTKAFKVGLYMMRAAIINEPLEGMTYRDIAEKADKVEAEAKAKEAAEKMAEEKARLEKEAKLKELVNAVSVEIVDKNFHEYKYEESISLGLIMKNTGSKNIKAFKGSVRVEDQFGKLLKLYSFTHEDPMPTGEKLETRKFWDCNKYNDDDNRIHYTEIDKLKLTWEPEHVIFEDGTELKVED